MRKRKTEIAISIIVGAAVVALLFFPVRVCAEDFDQAFAIENFFRGRKLDSVEGIWKWETSAGKYEGAIIRLERLSAPEEIRARFGRSIHYACFLTKPMRSLAPGTLKMVLKESVAGMHDGYYIMYEPDFIAGYKTDEIPFRVSVISEGTLAFGTIAPDGGERLNEATRVYPRSGTLSSFARQEILGTGFIVAPGIVATTCSNVATAEDISLKFSHGSAKARIAAKDTHNDLALLEVNKNDTMISLGNVLPIGDVREISKGDEIFLAAYEDVAGYPETRFVKGQVTQKVGEQGDPRVFETKIPAGKPRNGAPVLNSDFQVIGVIIDVAKNPFFRTSAMIPEGVSYVVKINNVFNLAASCRECPRLSPTEKNLRINELTVFDSIVLVRAEGVR
jgi:hypothetical protein